MRAPERPCSRSLRKKHPLACACAAWCYRWLDRRTRRKHEHRRCVRGQRRKHGGLDERRARRRRSGQFWHGCTSASKHATLAQHSRSMARVHITRWLSVCSRCASDEQSPRELECAAARAQILSAIATAFFPGQGGLNPTFTGGVSACARACRKGGGVEVEVESKKSLRVRVREQHGWCARRRRCI